MIIQRLFLITLVCSMSLSLSANAEMVSSGNNDDPINLGPSTAGSFDSASQTTADTALQTSADGSTSTAGQIINVDSSNPGSFAQYGGIDPETQKFILQLDACVKAVGASYCKQALQILIAKQQQAQQTQQQQAFAEQIALLQQAAMMGSTAAQDFLRQYMAQQQGQGQGFPMGGFPGQLPGQGMYPGFPVAGQSAFPPQFPQ